MSVLDEVPITELEKIDASRVDGVVMPANGIPFLLLKSLPEEATKDWAAWDADHEGGAGGAAGGDSKASAASAVARAKQTIADHKAGKKVSAADLKNAHEVHEAHLAHEKEEKAKASKKSVAKGTRDCPKCDKSFDADHDGDTCTNCGTKLPDPSAAKAADGVECPTCKGDGKIMGDKRDCPDCGASGSVTPAKAKTLAVKALVKAIVARKVDEAPDIAGGTAVIAQIADLIISEAQELKAGNTGEIDDIFQLAQAAELMWTWRTGEESVASGSVKPATALMQSVMDAAAKAGGRDYSAAERQEMASDGRALPDGSYPIADEHDLNSAAILARSGHGDAAAAAKHIGKRAKELGVANPLDSSGDTSKSTIAPEETSVDTVQQGNDSPIAKAVEDAVTKAMAPLQERITSLDAELAKVKATPIPGGPMMSVARQSAKADEGENWAAKAAYYREMADSVSQDPAAADGYRQLARKAAEKASA